jgi:hypothetical protein
MGNGSPLLRTSFTAGAVPLLVAAALLGAPVAHADGGITVPTVPAVVAPTLVPVATAPAVTVPATSPATVPAPTDTGAATGVTAPVDSNVSAAAAHEIVPAAGQLAAPVLDATQAATDSVSHSSPAAAPAPSTGGAATAPAQRPSRAQPVKTAPHRRLARTVGSAVTRVDRATFGISVASAVASAPLPNRATRLPRGSHELPAPPAPERRTDLGLGGAPAGASSTFVFFLIAASIALVLARPGLGGRVALLLRAPRPVVLILALERPD